MTNLRSILFFIIFIWGSTHIRTQLSDSIIYRLMWSPDAQLIAASEQIQDKNFVSIYDADFQLVRQFQVPDSVLSMAWSPDGSRLAARYATMWSALMIWDVTANLPPIFSEDIWGEGFHNLIMWSPNGAMIAVEGSSNVYIINAATGHLHTTLYNEQEIGNSGAVDLEWSPDGHFLYGLYNQQDEYIFIWNTLTSQIDRSFEKTTMSYAERMAVSHNRDRFAISDTDGVISIVNAQSGLIEKTLVVPSQQAGLRDYLDIVWSSQDNQIVALTNDARVYIWNVQSGNFVGSQVLTSSSTFRASISNDGYSVVYVTNNGNIPTLINIPMVEVPATPTPTPIPPTRTAGGPR